MNVFTNTSTVVLALSCPAMARTSHLTCIPKLSFGCPGSFVWVCMKLQEYGKSLSFPLELSFTVVHFFFLYRNYIQARSDINRKLPVVSAFYISKSMKVEILPQTFLRLGLLQIFIYTYRQRDLSRYGR